MDDVRFEIRNAEIEKLLREIVKVIGRKCPEGFGFTLLLFGFDPDNSLFYISNAPRDSMVKVMREFIQKQGKN